MSAGRRKKNGETGALGQPPRRFKAKESGRSACHIRAAPLCQAGTKGRETGRLRAALLETTDFLAVFFAAGFRAAVFLAAGFFATARLVVFLAAVLRAAGFRAAGFRAAVLRAVV